MVRGASLLLLVYSLSPYLVHQVECNWPLWGPRDYFIYPAMAFLRVSCYQFPTGRTLPSLYSIFIPPVKGIRLISGGVGKELGDFCVSIRERQMEDVPRFFRLQPALPQRQLPLMESMIDATSFLDAGFSRREDSLRHGMYYYKLIPFCLPPLPRHLILPRSTRYECLSLHRRHGDPIPRCPIDLRQLGSVQCTFGVSFL